MLLLCPACNTHVETKSMAQHLRNEHQVGPSRQVSCPYNDCYFTCSSLKSYVKHGKSKHLVLIPNEPNERIKSRPVDTPAAINLPQHDNDIELRVPENCDVEIPMDWQEDQEEDQDVHGINPPDEITVNSPSDDEDNELPFDKHLSEFESHQFKRSELLLSKLYAKNSLPRNAVPGLISIFKDYYNTALDELKKYIARVPSNINKINLGIDIIQDSFNELHTEHKTFKHLETVGALIRPVGVTIRTRLQIRRVQLRKTYKTVSTKIQTIPMKSTLKKFLELPNNFQIIIDYIEKKEKDTGPIISSMLQGSVWKYIKSYFPDKIVFPINLFVDDYEINNPLGSHKCKNKMTGVYYMISCLPSQFSAQLDNVFLAQRHKEADYSRLGNSANKVIYSNLKKELLQLQQERISITVDGK